MSQIPKPNENIAEYTLFLWQMEDLLRAFKFNIEAIEQHYLIPNFENEIDQRRLKELLIGLLEGMKTQEELVAHSPYTQESMQILEKMHAYLRDDEENKEYIKMVRDCDDIVAEFLARKSEERQLPFTQIAINILYGVLTLKLRKMDISPATQEAADKVKKPLIFLSQKFKELNA